MLGKEHVRVSILIATEPLPSLNHRVGLAILHFGWSKQTDPTKWLNISRKILLLATSWGVFSKSQGGPNIVENC